MPRSGCLHQPDWRTGSGHPNSHVNQWNEQEWLRLKMAPSRPLGSVNSLDPEAHMQVQGSGTGSGVKKDESREAKYEAGDAQGKVQDRSARTLLVEMLHEAAQLEHCLLDAYVAAACSLKSTPQEFAENLRSAEPPTSDSLRARSRMEAEHPRGLPRGDAAPPLCSVHDSRSRGASASGTTGAQRRRRMGHPELEHPGRRGVIWQ